MVMGYGLWVLYYMACYGIMYGNNCKMVVSGLICSYVVCYCFYVVVQRFFPTFDVLCVVCSGDFLSLTFLGLSVFG